ncbi:MAG: SGNH/GDSL hydrolase family protein [Bryobacteraceae bacterium]|jgi:lysophospholipase L1-like esterase
MKLRFALVPVLALIGCVVTVQAQGTGQERWVTTWATAQLLVQAPPPPVAAPAQAGQPAAAAGQPSPPVQRPVALRGFHNQTLRMMARVSVGGRRVRVRLANAFGDPPVAIGAAHIGLHAKDSEVVPGSDRALTFNGHPGCVIGPGVVMLSDPVDLTVSPLADLAVSLYFPEETGPPTTHTTALRSGYVSAEGNAAAQLAMPANSTPLTVYDWLAGIDVLAPADSAVIAAFGDSITDGARSMPDTNHAWPALLAARLAANKETANIAVANLGIGGNRVLRDGTGASALARFDRDVLGQSGVKWLMILEGINDIGRGATVPAEAVTADDLIGGYKQIVDMAHAHGIQAIGCTLLPFEGAPYYKESGEPIREAVNAWIRTSGAFDAVVDFEAATRDATNPRKIREAFDPGDHLHPNDAGYQALADAIDLSLFTGKRAPRN